MLTNRDYVGGVPLVIRLSDSDVLHATEKPAPVAFLLPRTTLLVAILKDVLQVFAPYTAALSRYTTQVWFSYEGTPISWVYPVGAIKDYVRELCQLRLAEQEAGAAAKSLHELPSNDDVSDEAQALCRNALLSQPVELDFRVHQSGAGGVVEPRVPILVNFEQLDQYIWHEVRQVHKASYTAIYGSSKYYFNEPEATLRPAIAMALYRPFGTVTPLPHAQLGSAIGADGDTTRSDVVSGDRDSVPRAASRASPVTADETSSPYLLSEYQHLLQNVLHRRHIAYVLQIAFPWAYRHASPDEPGRLRFHLARVPATPPLRSLASSLALMNEAKVVPDVATDTHDNTEPVVVDDDGGGAGPIDLSSPPAALVDNDEAAITLGLLLWRFFRVPCLRWWWRRQRDLSTTAGEADTSSASPTRASDKTDAESASAPGESSVAAETAEARSMSDAATMTKRAYDALFAALAPFYTDLPPELGGVEQILSEPNELQSALRSVSAVSARWEAACVGRLVAAYEPRASGQRRRGLAFNDPPMSGATSATTHRIFFALQGIRPSLRCPALYLETHLTSSDRALFITIEMPRVAHMPASQRAALCAVIGGADSHVLVEALLPAGDVTRATALMDRLCRDVDAIGDTHTLDWQKGGGDDDESDSARGSMMEEADWDEMGETGQCETACAQVLRALLHLVAGLVERQQQRTWLEVGKLVAYLFQRLEMECDALLADALLSPSTDAHVSAIGTPQNDVGSVWLQLADAHGCGNYCTFAAEVFRVCARIAPLRRRLLAVRGRAGGDATQSTGDFDRTPAGRLARLTSSSSTVTCNEAWQSLQVLLLPEDVSIEEQSSEKEDCVDELGSSVALVRYSGAICAMLLAALDVRGANFIAQGHSLRFLRALLDVSTMPSIVRARYAKCTALLVAVLQLCNSPLLSIHALAAAALAYFVMQPHKTAPMREILCRNRPALLELFAQEETMQAASAGVLRTARHVLQRQCVATTKECAKLAA